MSYKRLILASASPRRKEILEKYGYKPIIMESGFDETGIKARTPGELVKKLSLGKASSVVPLCRKGDLIIASDTVVSVDGKISGKPSSDEEAAMMIRNISGRKHQVYSGVTLIYLNNSDIKIKTFFDKTDVYVRELTDEEIDAYVKSGEPKGKAGAYAIQGLFGQYIYKICGDINTVIGLPGSRTFEAIREISRS